MCIDISGFQFKVLTLSVALGIAAFARSSGGFVIPEPAVQAEEGEDQELVNLFDRWELELDDGSTASVSLPMLLPDYTEKAVLTRSVMLDSVSSESCLFLSLLGYASDVTVSFNDSVLKSATYPLIPWRCELLIPNNLIRQGFDNIISITLLKADFPFELRYPACPVRSDPALYRVLLYEKPRVSISNVNITAETDDETQRSVLIISPVIFQNNSDTISAADLSYSKPLEIKMILRDNDGNVVSDSILTITLQEQCSVVFKCAPDTIKYWSQNETELYELEISINQAQASGIICKYAIRFGIKKISIRDGLMLINGKPFYMKGIAYIPPKSIENCDAVFGRLETDIRALKNLGFNTVRVPIDHLSSDLLNLTDMTGMLVLADFGMNSVPGAFLDNERLLSWSKIAIQEAIQQYGHHVSLLSWGLGSNLDFEEEGTRKFLNELKQEYSVWSDQLCYIETKLEYLDLLLDDYSLLLVGPQASGRYNTNNAGDHTAIIASLCLNSEEKPDDTTLPIHRYNLKENPAVSFKNGFVLNAYQDYQVSVPTLMQPTWNHDMIFHAGIISSSDSLRLTHEQIQAILSDNEVKRIGGRRNTHSYLFPITGLLILFLFAAGMHRSKVFRTNVNRVFLHTGGFFMDLRNRRHISTVQRNVLWFIIGLTVAVVFSSYLYSIRQSSLLDNLLAFYLSNSNLHRNIIAVIWSPAASLAFGFITAFAVSLILVVWTRLYYAVNGVRIDLSTTCHYAVWSMTPLLILLPISPFILRLIENPAVRAVTNIVILAVIVWAIWRYIHGVSIGLRQPQWRIWLTHGIAALAVIVILMAIAAQDRANIAYFEYLYHVYIAN